MTKAERLQIKEDVKPGAIEKTIQKMFPVWGAKRLRARFFNAFTGGFTGSSKSRRSLSSWITGNNDADSDILPDLPTLRERSRDLERNNPIASGAIKTKVINVVGPGLKHKSSIDRDVLNMTDEQADVWERNAEREWRLYWESQECDLSRTMNGAEIERMIYKQIKTNGEIFILFPRRQRKNAPYSLKIQAVEADRVCNEDNVRDTKQLTAGVEKDDDGAPIRYHILEQHPGNKLFLKNRKWKKIPAFGAKSGLRNVLHIYKVDRPGQTRGVPDLAAVIEPLKQLGRYTEAEIDAAVIAAFFTVFITTEAGDAELSSMEPTDEVGGKTSDDDYKLGKGAILGLSDGESIETANPGRPNANFDPFAMAILRQIGAALGLPFEVLIKHYQSSYSAARAALQDAWRYFVTERTWFASKFHQMVYEIFMYEAVSSGRINAPGFFQDPLIQKAYCGAEWVGPAKAVIDEVKEVKAASERINIGISTLQEETAQLTGGDWERKHPQTVKEQTMRKEAGLTGQRESGQVGKSGSNDIDDKTDKEDDEE